MLIRAIDIFYASKLGDLRRKIHLKQYAAALLLGMSQQEYSQLECGRKCFTASIISAIYQTFRLETHARTYEEHQLLFRPDVFVKLSEQPKEETIQKFLQLYYKRESLRHQLSENAEILRQVWNSITVGELDLDLPVIRVA